jgi:hypothetical protein
MSIRVVAIVCTVLALAASWYLSRESPPRARVSAATADAARTDASRSNPRTGISMKPGASASVATDGPDDTWVAPRSFHMSLSALDYCERTGWQVCREVEAFTAQMAQEPRDDAWAAGMENEIARAVAVAHPSAHVRALECRRRRCALEYAVPADSPDAVFGDLDLAGRLDTIARASLPERDPGQGTFIVTLMTLQAASP